ncbi:hypothetical protein GCM10023198_16920 [Promicromonospora umidemergens]|uniref:Uncharacterized protein n=1 Tax=Promicromonospora umidemergens TaxID=629679 RepID=A0ABP8X1Z5_9MICO
MVKICIPMDSSGMPNPFPRRREATAPSRVPAEAGPADASTPAAAAPAVKSVRRLNFDVFSTCAPLHEARLRPVL